MKDIIINGIVSMFEMEVQNHFTISNDKITIILEDGTNAKILVNNII